MINNFSDFNIHKICKEYSIENYTINNGLVDVDGSVDLSSWKLDKLPLNFGRVSRHFNCCNNLTSLEGAPKKLDGHFYCQYNELASLEGGPKEVGGNFNCNNNQLTTLQGAPKEVGGSFDCNFNNLTTLEGA